MSSDFNTWWADYGSGLTRHTNHDHEQHAERVAAHAWEHRDYREAMLRGEIATLKIENANLRAENAALKAQPVSNSGELASIPLKAWVVVVFQHLLHSPHTPDAWKRDLNQKTNALLNAIEHGKKGER